MHSICIMYTDSDQDAQKNLGLQVCKIYYTG